MAKPETSAASTLGFEFEHLVVVILAFRHLGKDDNKLTLEQSQVTKSELQTFWIAFRVLGSGRLFGEGNSYPLQYSGLENSMDCIWDSNESHATE